MLIYRKIKDNEYIPSFIGDEPGIIRYLKCLADTKDKSLVGTEWCLTKKGIDELSTKLNLPTISSIGESLKLKPYEYQKESVSEAISVDGGCLFSLPCGAGR